MSEHVSEHVDEGHRRLTLVKSVRWFYQSERLKDESQKRFHFVDSTVKCCGFIRVLFFGTGE